jgi:mannose-6-phosphate isomerase-like protein (cupin superfamily)
MDAFTLSQLVADRAGSGRAYLEFLRRPALSAGLYVLAPGEPDRQAPHTEDEVYVVLSGRAAIEVAGERRDVGAGSVVYVGRAVEHRFVDIVEELQVLVVFAPAEYDLAEGT